ncbi:hypothetical protein GCM10028783_42170 [Modestobacter muralis]
MNNEAVNTERANVRNAFHLVQQEVYSLLDSVGLVAEMVAHPKDGDHAELACRRRACTRRSRACWPSWTRSGDCSSATTTRWTPSHGDQRVAGQETPAPATGPTLD